MTTTYRAVATRDEGRYWLVHIVELDQYTQAKNLAEIESMAREYITVTTGTAPDSVEVQVKLPPDVETMLAEANGAAAESARLNAEAAALRVQAAKGLKSRGLTVREIGSMFGVSHQRAQQLVNS
jgi:hypothetical protein